MTRNILTLVCLAVFLCSPSSALSQTLGAAQDFAIVGGTTITAAGAGAQIVGDVGLSPGTSITGFPPAVVVPPYILRTPNDGPSVAARNAVNALFTSLSSGGPATALSSNQLAGRILNPGIYSIGAANLASGGTLRLDGAGTYIFRVSSSLTSISTSNMLLTGGAQACNVWWQVGSSATIGGATFAGNIVAGISIGLGPNATLDGRMLAGVGGAVTLDGNNTVNAAFCAAIPPAGAVGVSKAFSPAANGPGGISTLTITLLNSNAAPATLTTALIDTLPSGVVIAPSPNASTTCTGGAVSATPGGNTVTLSGGSVIPGGSPGSCVIIVNVTAAAVGTYTNTIPIGALITNQGSNPAPALAVLVISAIPPVPTLSEWAMIGLAGMLCLTAVFALRRRRTMIEG